MSFTLCMMMLPVVVPTPMTLLSSFRSTCAGQEVSAHDCGRREEGEAEKVTYDVSGKRRTAFTNVHVKSLAHLANIGDAER
jgi:hypothetical protein